MKSRGPIPELFTPATSAPLLQRGDESPKTAFSQRNASKDGLTREFPLPLPRWSGF
jgi:hypothetical protein